MEKYVSYDDLFKIEHYVRTKQWWDTIDSLMKLYGYVGLKDQRVDQLMLDWSKDPDKWVRRVAIEHQLLRKDRIYLVKSLKIILKVTNFSLIKQLVGH